MARRRALINIAVRTETFLELLAELLAEEDPAGSMKAQEVADLLNRKGVKTVQGGAWTVAAVRRPLRKARKLLADAAAEQDAEELAEMQAMPDWGRF